MRWEEASGRRRRHKSHSLNVVLVVEDPALGVVLEVVQVALLLVPVGSTEGGVRVSDVDVVNLPVSEDLVDLLERLEYEQGRDVSPRVDPQQARKQKRRRAFPAVSGKKR